MFAKRPYRKEHNISDGNVECLKVMWVDDSYKLHSVFNRTHLSYSIGDSIKAFRDCPLNILDEMYILDDEVVHAYSKEYLNEKLRSYRFADQRVVVKCIIPKGTPYWENEEGFATIELVIKEIIK